jgi:hypothetical protein
MRRGSAVRVFCLAGCAGCLLTGSCGPDLGPSNGRGSRWGRDLPVSSGRRGFCPGPYWHQVRVLFLSGNAACRDAPGTGRDHFGTGQDRFGMSQDRFGSSRNHFGSSRNRLYASQSHSGSSRRRFGMSQDRFGSSRDRFGSSQDRFGSSRDRSGAGEPWV